MEKSSKISILILAVSVIAAVALTAAAPKSPYTAQLASLQNKLAQANSNTSTLIDKSDSFINNICAPEDYAFYSKI